LKKMLLRLILQRLTAPKFLKISQRKWDLLLFF